MKKLNDINSLPIPKTVGDIYDRVPINMRISSSMPFSTKNNLPVEYLAILDYFYYKNYLFSSGLRDEVEIITKTSDTKKKLLSIFNIPYPDKIDDLALNRLVGNFYNIWKYKTTINGFISYLKALYGDWFHVEVSIQKSVNTVFSYYNFNYSALNTTYSSVDLNVRSSFFNPSVSNNLYKITLDVYTKINDGDIEYIKSIMPNFILFFQDNGSNLVINKKF